MSPRLHKFLLEVAVVLLACVVVSAATGFVVGYLFGLDGWLLLLIQAATGGPVGWFLGGWQSRQDELEEKRSEVES